MTSWSASELAAIGTADELRILSQRPDGTLRPPVIIWVVVIDDAIFVRAVRGPEGTWFRHVRDSGRGRISAGGIERDVTFTVETDPAIAERIDAAFRSKYQRFGRSFVDATITDQARAATIRLTPR